jgi:hypothetical protein
MPTMLPGMNESLRLDFDQVATATRALSRSERAAARRAALAAVGGGRANATRRAVLTALMEYINWTRDGFAFPAYAQIAEVTGYGADAVHAATRSLIRDGHLLTRPRFAKNGRQMSSAFAIPGFATFTKTTGVPVVDNPGMGDVKTTPHYIEPVHETCSTNTPSAPAADFVSPDEGRDIDLISEEASACPAAGKPQEPTVAVKSCGTQAAPVAVAVAAPLMSTSDFETCKRLRSAGHKDPMPLVKALYAQGFYRADVHAAGQRVEQTKAIRNVEAFFKGAVASARDQRVGARSSG